MPRCNHIIQLEAELTDGEWAFCMGGQQHVTAVLSPLCALLQPSNGAAVFAQVGRDIAATCGWLLGLRILHRDISAANIAQHRGRGVLLDFSASKVSACSAEGAWR